MRSQIFRTQSNMQILRRQASALQTDEGLLLDKIDTYLCLSLVCNVSSRPMSGRMKVKVNDAA